ncbi:IPT/TIG domain-containing protein [Mucilaginibacter myungsuensis]|uniref:IPT/TIG domain-containing protein n=1 Tax=Mucilaginibacter myungsuensis TaxID=649104 RepID=A0A929KU17_9SPHI|nr:IPT/TIG domain-containing protein [Mucilaginibacter myungsuensis]MBE9660415.1 IPT/TIG domain-containing protein [Mucilaginibacter myungsuensis]MDN3600457.1 IPT/TIG domain-containing protein [Mucilaginibacter myungsuensis]
MRTFLQTSLKPAIFLLLAIVALGTSCKKDTTTNIEPVPAEVTVQINSIQPKNPQPGDMVTITGTGFGTVAADVKLTVGTTAVTISSVTATEIKFAVPATLASGALALTVKGRSATNKDPQGAAVTVTPKAVVVPTFTAMTPATGKTGDVITLTGTGFNPQASENRVFFATNTGGTVVLATIKTASATQLTVEVPANVVTGGILITVSGTNAVPASGFNTTFTAVTTTGTGGVTVPYINSISGGLNFSLFATASKEIGAMMLDRVKSVIYYSDYTTLNQVDGQNTVYKVAIEGNGTPSVLTNDPRISKVLKIATDASGNVFVLKYEGTGPTIYSIYKITPDGATVTEIKKSFDIRGTYASTYFFLLNAQNEICMRPGYKITMSGEVINTESPLYGTQQKDGGAMVDGNSAFLIRNPDNNSKANALKFIKWNLTDGTTADAGFTVSSLFNTDDPSLFSSGANISYIKYVADGSNNLYAMMDHTYISGQITKTWMLRKYNLTTNTSTSIGTFNIKFPTVDLNDYNSTLEFVGDARGNLFFKANTKDIIMIKQ